MGKTGDRIWETAVFKRNLSRWAYAARAAQNAPLSALKQQSSRARHLRSHLDELIEVADRRLASPVENKSLPVAHNADWSWRPPLWQRLQSRCGRTAMESSEKLDDVTTVFHDCPLRETTIRQLRNDRPQDTSPYALKLDVLNFDGSFLSLAMDLPVDGSSGLSRDHILKMDLAVECERPIEIFVRLNIVHGPNTEHLVREVDTSKQDMSVEFDLASAGLNEKRVEKCWMDLIFEDPRMNQIVLRDIVVSRRPRAQV